RPAHEIRLVESATFETKNFVPHGISHWIDSQSGDVFLQVVSHPTYGDRIEIFRLSSDHHVATHVKSIANPLLYSINDVAAVGKESFYYSNDHYFVGGNLRKIEAVLQLPWGNVGVYEKNATRILDASLAYPNGVTLSPDGRYLYVACSTAGSLLIYSRDASTQTLTFRQMIDVTSCCDNLFVEANGHVWLGCHPRCLKTLVRFRSRSGLCDSHVLLVKLGPESEAKDGPPFPDYSIEQIYYDDGRELKASAVAVHYEGRLHIGSINNNLLYCEARSQGT
ncbi:serum paraoxonase/arylesterase 1-like, partial [Oscarella lobularis]|uniref:serum paraoxonase/arylesterase 1-like n=1 Tax=Oscarella lobularis TaxID=121494 RepID=UPI00331331BD